MKSRFSTNTVLFALVACLLWSTAFVGVKYGLLFAKPFSFAGMRFMLAGLILIPFCRNIGNCFKSIAENWKLVLAVSFFQTILLYAFFFLGMTMISGALGAIVTGSSPLLSALTAHILIADDEMTAKKSVSILTGIAGVVLISVSRQPWTAGGLTEFFGVILLILGATASAIGNVVVATEKKNVHPLVLNASQMFLGGLSLFIISLIFEGTPRFNYSLSFYAALLWLATISAVAFTIWFWLIKRPGVKVSELNLWKFTIPVCGALLSWALLPDESPELLSVIGMVFVASAIIVYNIGAKNNFAKIL